MRGRDRHHAGGEDHRDHAGHVDPQRQVGLAALGHPAADHPFGVLDRDPPLALLDEHHRGDDADGDERHDHPEHLIGVGPPRVDAVGDPGDDAGEDQQRDPVADPALGDQLADPHQQHGAGGQRDHDQEDLGQGEVGDQRRPGLLLEAAEQEHVADRLGEGEPDGQVARVLGDPRLTDLALLLELLQRRARPPAAAAG